MRRLLTVAVPVLAAGVLATELAMDLSTSDRITTYTIYGIAAVVAVVLYLATGRLSARASSLATAVFWVGISALVVTTVTVVLAAQSMFFSEHDRDVVLVVLGMGFALSAALSYAIGRSAAADLGRIERAAAAVADGDLTVRTGVTRRDELGTAARSFDAMATRLQAVEEERRIFLASVGHDLRTPLASLRAAIEAVEDGVAPDPDAYLAGMRSDVEHLGRLVDDLFQLARIESGGFEPRLEQIDLRELVDETVEVLTPLARRGGVELAVVAAGPAPAEVDPAAIGRVLRNLVDNALRHSPPGATVTVEVGEGGIAVVDEGPGFPPGFEAAAFRRITPFHPARRAGEADPPRRGGGAGLGLAIARGLVEAHGGTVAIGDGPGGRVEVRL